MPATNGYGTITEPPSPEEFSKLPFWARVAIGCRETERYGPEMSEKALSMGPSLIRGHPDFHRSMREDYERAVDSARRGILIEGTSKALKSTPIPPSPLTLIRQCSAIRGLGDFIETGALNLRFFDHARNGLRYNDVWADYELGMLFTSHFKWDDSSPVDPDIFGSLVAGRKRHLWTDPPAGLLHVELSLPSVVPPDQSIEVMADSLASLNELYIAMGGSGLRVVDAKCYQPSFETLPSGPGDLR